MHKHFKYPKYSICENVMSTAVPSLWPGITQNCPDCVYSVCQRTLYHSCSSWSENSVFSLRSCSISGRSLLFCFPMAAGQDSWFTSLNSDCSTSQAAFHTCQSDIKTQEVSSNQAERKMTFCDKWEVKCSQSANCGSTSLESLSNRSQIWVIRQTSVI